MKNKFLYVVPFCLFLFISNQLFSNDVIHAVKKGNLTRLKELVAQGADINEQNIYLQTPLHIAIQRKHYQIAKFLIENGADLNTENNLGLLPLNIAAINAKYKSPQKIYSYREVLLLNGEVPFEKKYQFNYKDIILIKLLAYKQTEQNKTELTDELCKICDLPILDFPIGDLPILDFPIGKHPVLKICHLLYLLDTVEKSIELDKATEQLIQIIKSKKLTQEPADKLSKLLASNPKTKIEIPRELKIKSLFKLLKHTRYSFYRISSKMALQFPEIIPEIMSLYSDIYGKIQEIRTMLNITNESDTSYKPTYQVSYMKRIITAVKDNEQHKKINRNLVNMLTLLHWCHGSNTRKVSPDVLAYTLSFSDGDISKKLLISSKNQIRLKKIKKRVKRFLLKK